MERRLLFLLLSLLLLAGSLRAQDGEPERIECRVVSSVTDGVVRIDRGSADGLAVGDAALFLPRQGGTRRGRVLEVLEREATVELDDSPGTLEPGTRGVVEVPRARLAEDEENAQEPARAPKDAEPPTLQDAQDVWTPDQPLLAGVRAVRPETRDRRMHGRLYLAGHGTYTTDSDRSDLFLRAGTDLRVQNPFGRGGALRFDGELQARRLSLPDEGDDEDGRLRIDRLSYRSGGTRFAPSSWESGRFLQTGVAEFGVLDGYQWTHRLRSGDRYGAGIGYLPEPDAEQRTGDDLQISAFYTWSADPRELFTATAGVQKTWHEGSSDRDLLLAKVHYVGERGWSFHGTTWIDWYDSSDDTDSGLDLTQALLSLTRRTEDGDGLDFRYRRSSIPEIDRNEFLPVGVNELEDGFVERLSFTWWTATRQDRRYETEVGIWRDEDETGGDVEVLHERPMGEDLTGRLSTFATAGEFSAQFGGRVGLAGPVEGGSWDVSYEVADHRLFGFSDDRDDLIQHRLQASRDVRFGKEWVLTLSAAGLLHDDDGALTIGVTLQRSF